MDKPTVEAKPLTWTEKRKPKGMTFNIDKQSFTVQVVPGQTIVITVGNHTISFQVPE
jgi:hypothetical protein